METFGKAIAVIILTVILGVTLGKAEKDISVVLSVAACCIITIVVLQYLEDVIASSNVQTPIQGYKNHKEPGKYDST